MEQARRTFIPAAGRDWSLPLYDPLVKLIGGDRARRTLIERAAIRPSQRVLDVGCGTGSLAIAIARLHPGADVVGIDPDPKALARARRKAVGAGVSIQFDGGFADGLSYPDAAFDHLVSSFVFHHLEGDGKAGMFREARRVLKPGGFLYLLDFDGPESGPRQSRTRWLQSRPRLLDNAEDRIVARMRQAGLEDPRRVAGGSVMFGLVPYSCFEATSPFTPMASRAAAR